MVKVHRREGVANHSAPRVMRACPQGHGRSVDRGACGLGIEPRNLSSSWGRPCQWKGKATSRRPLCEGGRGPGGVVDPAHACTHFTRKPGGPTVGHRGGWSASRTRKGHGDDERRREVRRAHSTGEAVEQWWRCADAGGGRGGKGTDQGNSVQRSRDRAQKRPSSATSVGLGTADRVATGQDFSSHVCASYLR